MSAPVTAEYDQLKQSGLFDSDFYLIAYPDVARSGMDPLLHYVLHGAVEGRRPRPDFDVDFYLDQCEKTGGERVRNPLLHYLHAGHKLGLEFDPTVVRKAGSTPEFNSASNESSPATDEELAFVHSVIQSNFDHQYYLSNFSEPLDADPVDHFVQVGWREGRNPRPDFDVRYYLDTNPDVVAADINPFFHFLVAGKAEGRAGIRPNGESAPSSGIDPYVRATVQQHLDIDFYLCTYPDVATAGVDPVDHYLVAGWLEGRDPCWAFDTSFYLEQYADVKEAGVNPFFHYLVAGKLEGRRGHDELGIEIEVLRSAVSAQERAISWAKPQQPRNVSHVALSRTLRAKSIARSKGICIAFSHDNYLEVVGGIQNCLADEQKALNRLGIDYVQVFPTQPLPTLSDATRRDRAAVTVTINGVLIGPTSLSALGAAIKPLVKLRSSKGPRRVSLIIHSLLGHSPEAICRLASEYGISEVYFWLHDYNSLCESFTLLRNDLSYCAGPDLKSTSCSVCVYGSDRQRHVDRISRLFKVLRPVILSPSQAALDVWRAASNALVRSDELVIPHCEVVRRPIRKRPSLERRDTIRVGFLGFDKYHKGWATFTRLAERFQSDHRLEFVHLGRRAAVMPYSHFIPVEVTRAKRDAMVQAVRKAAIDVVVIWPAWPETFSFVVFEALAGGALIVTNDRSGNVASAVLEEKAGWVLQNEDQLQELFAGRQLRRRVSARRRERSWIGRLKYSGCTATVFKS